MQEAIQSIIAIGGFGFLNYQIYARTSNQDMGSESDRRFFIGLISSMDYIIYLLLMKRLNDVTWSVTLAVLLSIVITLFLPKIIDIMYVFLNWIRRGKGLPIQKNVKVYTMFTSDLNRQRCFVFSLSGGQLMSSGYLLASNGRHEEKSLILQPFHDNDEERYIESMEELEEHLLYEKIEARIYLNFEKNIKLIYF